MTVVLKANSELYQLQISEAKMEDSDMNLLGLRRSTGDSAQSLSLSLKCKNVSRAKTFFYRLLIIVFVNSEIQGAEFK